MSEPAFARLLFTEECFASPGSSFPGSSGINGSRNCSFIAGNCLSRKFPEIENISLVKELLPSILNRHSGRGFRRYYIPAIYEIATAIEDHENLILARTPGAEEAFEELKTTQKSKISVMLRDAPVFDKWYSTYRELVSARDAELTARRKEVFTAKLLAEGYDPDDIRSTFYTFSSTKPLTEDGWNAIRSDVVDAVTLCKTNRLEWARKRLVNARRAIANRVLTNHPIKANIDANAFSPSLEELTSGFEPISLVVDREDNGAARAEDFNGVLEGIEEWVEEWRTKRQTDMLEIMVAAGSAAISDPPMEQDVARLRLATTMFSCKKSLSLRRSGESGGGLMCPTLLGQHSSRCRTFKSYRLGNHFRPKTACLRYHSETEEMIHQLIVTVRQDPETTTADQIDDLDTRFYYQGCPKWDGLARSWRNCAAHFREHPLSTFQGWVVVPPADKIEIVRREISNVTDPGCRVKCSRHGWRGYESASSFQRHINHCLWYSGDLKLEDVSFDPLVPPQPISLDGRTSESMSPPVSPSNEISKSSRRRQRRRH
ncbi:hypothetical protein FRB93_006762 [Tulasnella sp. JGI-2019a]|nr:hypothetical protein FRB93_006762 [Tulasnella sp. JGI-2019a]